MTQYISDDAKNSMLASIVPTHIGLHSADPSANGLANELTSGQYARTPCMFGAAINGVRQLDSDVDFFVSQGDDIQFISYWNNTSFLMSESISRLTFLASGVLTINGSTTVLSI
jgi:hypothetical protein